MRLLIVFSLFILNLNTFGQFKTLPYIQIGESENLDKMVVMWHTDTEIKDFKIKYHISGNQSKTKEQWVSGKRLSVSGTTNRFIYEATLFDLIPGKLVTYEIWRGKTKVFSSEFKAQARKDEEVKMVVFGDVGTGTEIQRKIGNLVMKEQPQMVAISGDIVYNRGLVHEYDENFYPYNNAPEYPFMSRVPFFVAPGNHDLETRDLNKYNGALAYYYFWNQPLNGPDFKENSALHPELIGSDSLKKDFYAYTEKKYPVMSNYSFNYGDSFWLVLDSNPYVNWSDSTLIKWVKNEMEKAKDFTWKFVMFHHPGFNSSRAHYEQQQMRILSPLFEAGKVDVVFNGHVHNYQRTFPMNFLPYGTGSRIASSTNQTRGKVISGKWTLDKIYDGKTQLKPNGPIYIVTGAGGRELYDVDQTDDKDSWQPFTCQFYSVKHSFTSIIFNSKSLKIKQIDIDGNLVEEISIVKP
ncbi:MAG: metallophosphoesterase family protein [Bacteroidetes bacterium]|nr:metallophosphoesterase family protein [Bacteroidota bacterium]